MIPKVDIAALFGPPSPAREAVDRAIMAAAEDIGFLTVAGIPPESPHGAEDRRDLRSLSWVSNHVLRAEGHSPALTGERALRAALPST